MKEQKFNQIVTENSETIRRICRYYNKNEEDQQDMYQEILINIWKSLDNFRGDASLSTWIYRIAVNISMSFSKKSFKHSSIYINADTENLHTLVSDEESNKEQEEVAIENLQNALNSLSVIDNILITLMLEGLSTKEIANVVGITEPNVRVKIHRIKTQLKEQLKK